MTTRYKNVYVGDAYTIASVYEKDGPIANYFDKVYDKDLYYGQDTFEKAEEKMLYDSIKKLINKVGLSNKDIDYVISGDLQNQIAASDYAMRSIPIPFIGVYSACATFGLGLFIASNFIEGKNAKNIVVSTSSHNMVAERQFRNPTEYGAPKKKTTTWTSTGAASMLLTNKKSKIKISASTCGIVRDGKINDVNNMGAVMAIAAGDTIKRHLEDLSIEPNYYDLILTGDLGCYGKEILIDYMNTEYGLDISANYNDAGTLLYDYDHQEEVNAGGSGPVCSALVNYSYILPQMQKGTYQKILFVATGALFSPTFVFQHENIVSIAHAISLEAI